MAESSNSPPVVVCDAGPLIHLDELGCLNLLLDFPKVLVPHAVWEEVEKHRRSALNSVLTIVRTAAPGFASAELEAMGRVLALHRGEAEALRLAEVTSGCILLTDDSAARLAGRNLGLRVHGTLGIVLRAIRRKQRTKEEVVAILRSLPARSTLHVSQSLLQDIIQEVQGSESGL
jgi:predicted nucleic acid-binding protein